MPVRHLQRSFRLALPLCLLLLGLFVVPAVQASVTVRQAAQRVRVGGDDDDDDDPVVPVPAGNDGAADNAPDNAPASDKPAPARAAPAQATPEVANAKSSEGEGGDSSDGDGGSLDVGKLEDTLHSGGVDAMVKALSAMKAVSHQSKVKITTDAMGNEMYDFRKSDDVATTSMAPVAATTDGPAIPTEEDDDAAASAAIAEATAAGKIKPQGKSAPSKEKLSEKPKSDSKSASASANVQPASAIAKEVGTVRATSGQVHTKASSGKAAKGLRGSTSVPAAKSPPAADASPKIAEEKPTEEPANIGMAPTAPSRGPAHLAAVASSTESVLGAAETTRSGAQRQDLESLFHGLEAVQGSIGALVRQSSALAGEGVADTSAPAASSTGGARDSHELQSVLERVSALEEQNRKLLSTVAEQGAEIKSLEAEEKKAAQDSQKFRLALAAAR
eukprot:TRINITY_DN37435_c0_g1_i1.p1 TRINITY_DN37435_c0_g1~~TRINITY_DN37435_c0_g1_i1.p1  ORF type:complete len:466 (-),score=126.67 TRINITY_DN37435_c0_g1_i1:94-1431(-)